jgi:hypothetical protein
VFYGGVVFEGVAAGFEHVISVLGGGCHEEKFDPFASLLISLEIFAIVHSPINVRFVVPLLTWVDTHAKIPTSRKIGETWGTHS